MEDPHYGIICSYIKAELDLHLLILKNNDGIYVSKASFSKILSHVTSVL